MHELSFLLHSDRLRFINHLPKLVLKILEIGLKGFKRIIELCEPHIWFIPWVFLTTWAMLQLNLVLSFKSLFRGHRRIRLITLFGGATMVVWVRITCCTSLWVVSSRHVHWFIIHQQSLFLNKFVQGFICLYENLNVGLCINLLQAWREVFSLQIYTLTKFIHEPRKTIHFLFYEIYLIFISGLYFV
jgi:hypothetical protein